MAENKISAVIELKDDFTYTIKKAVGACNQLQKETEETTYSMKHMDKTSKGISSTFGSLKGKILGLAASYISLRGAFNLFRTGLSTAANFEQYRNTLNVVMKDQKKAAETMAWAVEFANRTPFETDEIVQATVKLQSYGLVAKDVMGTIGDMAGVMGKSLDQAVEAVADAQQGELERLKEFGISKQMIIDHANKIMRGKQIVNNKGQITDQKAFNKALFSLMKERFQGGMEQQARTYKGVMSTLRGVFSNTLAQMMGVTATGEVKIGGALDQIKNKAIEFTNKINELSQNGKLEEFGNNVAKVFGALGDTLTFVIEHSAELIGITAGLATTFGTLKIISTIKGLMDLWKASTFATTVAQQGLNAALMANPIGLVVGAIGLLVGVLVTLELKFGLVTKAIKKAWEWLTKWKKSEPENVAKAREYRTTETRIGRNASGTHSWSGGLTWVGERGPELVELPKGSKIIPNYQAKNISKSSSITIAKLADTIIVREEADIDKIATALANKIQKVNFNMA